MKRKYTTTKKKKNLSERRKREADETTKVSESKWLRLLDDSLEVAFSINEEPGYDQQKFSEGKKTAGGSAAKGSSGDSSFKENPYIYLSQDDPALISCLYCPHSFAISSEPHSHFF
jgi:hypothetical protein